MFTQRMIHQELINAAKTSPDEIIIVTPFLSFSTLKEIIDYAPNSKITLVTKDDAVECASGYNDINAWREVWRLGGKVFFCENLHAKYYRFDNIVFVGSANLTNSGVGTSQNSNYEILTKINFNEHIREIEKDLLSNSVYIEPEDPLILEFERTVEQLITETKFIRQVTKAAYAKIETFHFRSRIKPKLEVKSVSPLVPSKKETSLVHQDGHVITRHESCSAVLALMKETINRGYTLTKDNLKVSSYCTPTEKPFSLVWVSSGLKRESPEENAHELPIVLALHPDIVTEDIVKGWDPNLRCQYRKNSNLHGFPVPFGSTTNYGLYIFVNGHDKLFDILKKYEELPWPLTQ